MPTDIEARLIDHLKAKPQYLLPGHLLSRLMLGATRLRPTLLKDAMIRAFIRWFDVDMSQAVERDPAAYPHFNAFFTRALRPETRPVVSGPGEVACPVDGTISQLGGIADGRIFQAKGHDYGLEQLLGGQAERAAPFRGGSFATIYLSPRDYHRIHMPLDGNLREMVHVPGRLFSVSPATTRAVPGLFARNERVVALFDTDGGPMAVVLVGAVFVAGIETAWAGLVSPPAGRVVRRWRYEGADAVHLRRGEELGRFNMGSTVIVLFGPEQVRWAEGLAHGTTVRMGQLLGRYTDTPKAGEGLDI